MLPVVLAAGVRLTALAGEGADVALSIKIDPPEVVAGETAHVDVVLSWTGAQDAYAVEQWNAPELAGQPLTAVSDDFATVQESGHKVFRRRVSYAVQAGEPGTVSLSPARVTIKPAGGAAQEFKTQALGVIVRPARAPVPVELIAGIACVGLLGVAVRLARRAPPPPPPKDRAERAREVVDGLRSVGHRDHREFFAACVDALREGMADVAPAVARDRGKLVQALHEAGVSEERCRAAEELVSLCDAARFNPEPPGPQERERALGLLQTALS